VVLGPAATIERPVRIEASGTTVGRLLSRVGAVAGLDLRAGSDAVAEEPVFFFGEVRLRELMELLPALFQPEGAPEPIWRWRRGEGAGSARYTLVEDLRAAQLARQARHRGRQAFARELETRTSADFGSARQAELLLSLPRGLVRAALTEGPQVVRWSHASTRLREAMNSYAGPDGAGPDTRVEVRGAGNGSSSTLHVMIFREGQGGAGVRFRSRVNPPKEALPLRFVFWGPDAEAYSGMLARPTRLPRDAQKEWNQADYRGVLTALAAGSGVPVASDDYGYLLAWPEQRPLPAGEPLGVWIRRVQRQTRSVISQTETLLVREHGKILTLRNDAALGDSPERPSAATRAWLRRLRSPPGGSVLRVDQLARLLAECSEANLAFLSVTGLLPSARGLNGARSTLKLWSVLTPVQRALLTTRGIGMADLTPQQRGALMREGPGQQPILSERSLRSTQRDPVYKVQFEGETLVTTITFRDQENRLRVGRFVSPLRVDAGSERLEVTLPPG
jgi:hypothetical protein